MQNRDDRGISEFEYRSIEIIHLNKRGKKLRKKLTGTCWTVTKGLTFVLSRVSE